MQRRDVLRLLTSSAVLSAMPMEAMMALQQARADAGPFPGLRTLNAHQNATVTTISELIIPATDTPGATGAKVNEFLDLMLTDWFEQQETAHFLEGLATVDARSRKLFGKDFVDCTVAQQTQLMKQMDGEAMESAHNQGAEARKRAMQHDTSPAPQNFFYTLKRLTLVGYYTSEVGFENELGQSIIPASHSGCAPLQEARQ
ncbi:gluconate 2-dehydrogenase subunit 3 family protein [Acidicapsa dinghuensis]|uniref:Gluconate 2-dehydrogenase subunit 3 family protein n=1 Tax=Acidicapsa dinghuensis TaxID=2218256 RepID=A0ABW1EFE8_9BACT|nr:gluconate 2-dehydrogenase subunit 3 family protein [Acidicapsa dinghuensis]